MRMLNTLIVMYIASCLYPLQRAGSIIIVQTPVCFGQ